MNHTEKSLEEFLLKKFPVGELYKGLDLSGTIIGLLLDITVLHKSSTSDYYLVCFKFLIKGNILNSKCHLNPNAFNAGAIYNKIS